MAACPKVQLNNEQLNTHTDEVIRHQTFKTNELPNFQFAAYCVADFFLYFSKNKMPKEEKFKWNEASRYQVLELKEVDYVTSTNHEGELQVF